MPPPAEPPCVEKRWPGMDAAGERAPEGLSTVLVRGGVFACAFACARLPRIVSSSRWFGCCCWPIVATIAEDGEREAEGAGVVELVDSTAGDADAIAIGSAVGSRSTDRLSNSGEALISSFDPPALAAAAGEDERRSY